MTTFSLEIQIGSAGLATLHAAGQKVAIVKETTPTSMPVIWVSFFPEESSKVTWNEIYDVYTSNTQIQSGATIQTSSTFQAVAGNTYPFSGGQFQAGTPGLTANQYGVKNADKDFQLLTVGLAQSAGGTPRSLPSSPLNATIVPFNDTGEYTPIEKVSVFATAEANNGLVISQVESNALLVDFTKQTSQTITYNAEKNVFALKPPAS